MNDALLAILVCPLCKGSLLHNKTKQELICKKDQLAYPIKDEIPIMIADKARKISENEYN